MTTFDADITYDGVSISGAEPSDSGLVLTLSTPTATLDLNDLSTGIIVTSVDLGAPAVRETVDDLPGMDGAYDLTQYLGQRVVTIQGTILESDSGASPSKALDLLAPYLAPGARPTLTFALDGDMAPRTLGLRASQWTAPRQAASYPFQLQFKADPVAYSATPNMETVPAYSGPTAGFSFPLTFPLTFPAGGSTGLVTVTSNGTYPTWPVYRLFGPITNPVIALLDPLSGVELGRVGVAMTVAAGDYLEIATRYQMVTLNGTSSRYSFLDFANTTWVPLQPGGNLVRYSGTNPAVPASAIITWQDGYL